jgi:hypothetical protein
VKLNKTSSDLSARGKKSLEIELRNQQGPYVELGQVTPKSVELNELSNGTQRSAKQCANDESANCLDAILPLIDAQVFLEAQAS